jgi:hypothetical protein
LSFEKKSGPRDLVRHVYEEKGEMDKTIVAVTLFYRGERLIGIEFYSTVLGIAKWDSETGKIQVKTWEEEEVAQKVSHLNHHYTGKVLAEISLERSSSPIIEDCLQKVKNREVLELVTQAMKPDWREEKK